MKNKCASNRKFEILLLLCLVIIFTACDPVQTLKIENKTNANASIQFVFYKGHKPGRFEGFIQSDTLKIQLDTTRDNRVKDYHFGIGTWKIDNRLDSLVGAVESIAVETWKSKTTCKGHTQVKEFLSSRVSGDFKESIIINLE